MRRYRFILIIFIIGVLVRGIFLYQSLLNIPVSTDEALVGLMSKQILRGEFPVFFLGQPYSGPVDAYLGAFLTLLFGTCVFTIRLYHILLSILFMILIYVISKNAYGKEIGILSLIQVSIPSSYFMVISSYAQPPYMSLMAIGAIIFYLSIKIVAEDLTLYGNVSTHWYSNRVLWRFLIFGLLSGLSIWMHFLSIVFIIPAVLFVFLNRPKVFLKNLFITAIFFIMGMSPLIIGKSTAVVAESVDIRAAFLHLRSLIEDTLPGLLGIRAIPFIDTDRPIFLHNLLTIPAGIIYTLCVLIFLYICVKSIFVPGKLRMKFDHLLLIFLFFTSIVFCFSKRSGAHEYRYILPLYFAIPIIVARITTLSRRFSYFSVIIIVTLNLYGNITVIKKWNTPDFAREYGNLPRTDKLITFLKSHNIKHAYGSYWLSYRLTLETNEEIICSQPYNERFIHSPLKYLDDVDAAKNVAFIFTDRYGIPPSFFEENLVAIGGIYRKKQIGDFVVFYNFQMYNEGFKSIPRTNWHAYSNFGTDNLLMAYDGNILTRWGSAHPQEPGMYFKIDLDKVHSINKIVIDNGRFITDGPRGYKIELSVDDVIWKDVINMPRNIGHLSWINGHPKLLLDGGLEVIFKTQYARFIRIVQTGSDQRYDWSIAECFAYQEN